MRLEEVLTEHIHKDELTGDYIVAPLEDVKKAFTPLRESLRWALDSDIHKKDKKRYRPLKELLLNYYNGNYGKGKINEPKTRDDNGETSMGKAHEQNSS
jgi:hypothetical protein